VNAVQACRIRAFATQRTLAIISIYFKLKAILRPRKAFHAESVMLSRLSSVFTASALAILSLTASPSVAAEITVGLVTTMSGPGASIGIPYARGAAAGAAYAASIGDYKIHLIQLDDASDPSAAARNARKLVEEDKADILMGTSGVPGSVAMSTVATETKTPMISLTPIPPVTVGPTGQWLIAVPQPPGLMVAAVVDRMKKDGVKSAAYIGFSDSWGDLVYNALMKSAPTDQIEVTTNERYARADTSVTGQILKIVSTHPDAVITGGSGTPGALPYIALAERGYKGGLYGTHALINPDFVRVGGQAVEGVIAPTGPVVVAEQLPDSYPTKKIALAFREAYQKANNAPTNDAFSAYAFDAWLVFVDAAKRALSHAQPGTPEFRTALRDAMTNTHDVIGTHAVYNFKPGDTYGVDERSRVLVKLANAKWTLLP
jgi:branched-chain amino acid transport system substrate-binding protein